MRIDTDYDRRLKEGIGTLCESVCKRIPIAQREDHLWSLISASMAIAFKRGYEARLEEIFMTSKEARKLMERQASWEKLANIQSQDVKRLLRHTKWLKTRLKRMSCVEIQHYE